MIADVRRRDEGSSRIQIPVIPGTIGGLARVKDQLSVLICVDGTVVGHLNR